MKILNKENHKKVLYISVDDVSMLNSWGYYIPKENQRKNGYYRITDEDEIEFFMQLDFIVDYRKAVQKTIEEIDEEIRSILNQRPKKYPKEPLKFLLNQKKERKFIDSEETNIYNSYEYYDEKSHQVSSLLEMKDAKKGRNKIELPEVMDSYGVIFTMESANHCLGCSLNNHDLVFIEKKDKTKEGDIEPEALRIYLQLTGRENDPYNIKETGKGKVLVFNPKGTTSK